MKAKEKIMALQAAISVQNRTIRECADRIKDYEKKGAGLRESLKKNDNVYAQVCIKSALKSNRKKLDIVVSIQRHHKYILVVLNREMSKIQNELGTKNSVFEGCKDCVQCYNNECLESECIAPKE